MKYPCKIVGIDDEEVTVEIEKNYITGFVNCGTKIGIGEKAIVDIELYGDLEITQCNEYKPYIERKAKTFQYTLWGILDIDNAMLHSTINFDISIEELFNYGYLDGKAVKVDVLRIDFCFDR